MRWSFEELIFAWKIYREYRFSQWIKHFPKNYWRRFKLVLRWLFTGYARETLWSLDDYILRVIIFRIEKFIEMKKTGYPYSCENETQWFNELNLMLYKLKTMLDESILEDLKYPENVLVKKVIDGKSVNAFDFGDEETQKHNEELFKKQAKNNEEALEMLIKYFNDLWD